MADDLAKTLLTLFNNYNHILNSNYLRTEDGFEDSEDIKDYIPSVGIPQNKPNSNSSENTMEKINTHLNQIDSRLYNIEKYLKEISISQSPYSAHLKYIKLS